MNSSDPAPLPAAVWQLWLRPRQVAHVTRVGGGFSGARIYRCSAPGSGAAWALRCWPPETAPERVAQIHSVLALARHHGCDLVPAQLTAADGRSWTPIGDRVWEMSAWCGGQPYSPASGVAPDRAIAAAAAAVARFHAAVSGIASRRATAPAIAERLRRIEQLDAWLRQPLDRRAWPAELASAAAVASQAWRLAMPAWRDRLAAAAPQRRPLQYVLRDVHREHVLFDGPNVTALIDFDALRIDTPATDLARLVTSFIGDLQPPAPSERLWQAAAAGYRQHRPLSDDDDALVRLLAEVSPLISLLNWVIWIGCEHRRFDADGQRVTARIEHLTRLVRITCGLR